jgi:heme-degrading monooxygenase HmoA
MHVLIVNFRLDGIDEAEYEKLCDDVAPAFAAVPGLVSKIWLKDSERGIYGGVYLWESRDALDRYKESDLFKSIGAHPNLVDVTAREFEVLESPTRVTNGLLATTA